MSKITKTLISILLVILLTLPVLSMPAMASLLNDNSEIISDNIICDDEVEEKIICDATIEDKFADDSVIVVLKKDVNPDFRTLTQTDFPEIQAKNVETLV